MSWTKRELIAQAFSEIGITDYQFDLTASQIAAALRTLDAMVAEWDVTGWTYPAYTTPSASDIDEDSALPAYAIIGVYTSLAVALAPTYGKVPSDDTKRRMRAGMAKIRAETVTIPARASDTTQLPLGAGHKDNERINVVESTA